MVIKIISNDKYSKRYYKKKTNEFFNRNNKDWVNNVYLYVGDILFQLLDGGVFLDSLYDSEIIYTMICKYIEFLFINTEITIYGSYNIDKLSQVEGVKISEV